MNFAAELRNTARQIEADVSTGKRVFKHGILVERDTRVQRMGDGSGYSVVRK